MSITHDLGPTGKPTRARGSWLTRLAGSQGFQRWAARFPLTRGIVRREGEAMFDLVAGFCHTQVLRAFVGLKLPQHLEAPADAEDLALRTGVPMERMRVLLRAGAAIGLVKERRGQWRLTVRGAALASVPGLPEMIAHHDVLYRDLADPVAFFRGETTTELAQFWPYVFGAGAATDPDTADRYSQLMTDSQKLVAQDTLALIDFKGVAHHMDIGGGTGEFLKAVRAEYPEPDLSVFDLPAVLSGAELSEQRITARPGSFRDDPLPTGAESMSLVRVLYDHSDDTVRGLLRKVHDALPIGGQLIISEPMTGNRAGDAYFALYCMAMETGRTRSASEISALLAEAGFSVGAARSRRPFVTTVIKSVRES